MRSKLIEIVFGCDINIIKLSETGEGAIDAMNHQQCYKVEQMSTCSINISIQLHCNFE